MRARQARTALKRLGLAAFALFPVAANAALAPNYQRLAELNAILQSPGVVSAFAVDDPIRSLEYVSADRYRVSSKRCTLAVEIVGKPLPQGMVGARQFDVVAGKPACTRR